MPPKKKAYAVGPKGLGSGAVAVGPKGWKNKNKTASPPSPQTPAPQAQAPAPAPASGPDQTQQSAWAYMQQQLDAYGLSSLAPIVQNLIAQGITDENQINLELQATNEWKTRFAGNERLRAKGLPVLSVAEYLATEKAYFQAMSNYGLPSGFYDDPSDFAGFIANGMSPNELNERLAAWNDLAKREDPAVKDQLRSMGISDGDLLAYMIDPAKANSLIQAKFREATVGAAARRSGLSAGNAQRLADLGITEQQAIQGYGMISEGLDEYSRAGSIYGDEFTQGDYEAEVFEGSGDAARKRKRLASRERGAFSGSSGVGQGSLGRSTGGTY